MNRQERIQLKYNEILHDKGYNEPQDIAWDLANKSIELEEIVKSSQLLVDEINENYCSPRAMVEDRDARIRTLCFLLEELIKPANARKCSGCSYQDWSNGPVTNLYVCLDCGHVKGTEMFIGDTLEDFKKAVGRG